MTVWEAMEKLNTLIDESDPDTSLSQIEPENPAQTGVVYLRERSMYFRVVREVFQLGWVNNVKDVRLKYSYRNDNPLFACTLLLSESIRHNSRLF